MFVPVVVLVRVHLLIVLIPLNVSPLALALILLDPSVIILQRRMEPLAMMGIPVLRERIV
jgi:hypothetical protein